MTKYRNGAISIKFIMAEIPNFLLDGHMPRYWAQNSVKGIFERKKDPFQSSALDFVTILLLLTA